MKKRALTIGFYTEGPPFDGGTLEERALGGSETALIQAARALSDKGNRILVFNNCHGPGTWHGVDYFQRRDLPRRAATGFDVFIVSRFYGIFQAPMRAGLKVLWNHDTLDQAAGLRVVQDQVDVFFVLSKFHASNYLTRLPGLEPRMAVTRNGVDLDLISRSTEGCAKDENAVIYASRPERGLQNLLQDIWPELRKKRPDLKLYLCGYKGDPASYPPELRDLYGKINELVRTSPNVIALGALTKQDYYRRLASSSLMLYPCVFSGNFLYSRPGSPGLRDADSDHRRFRPDRNRENGLSQGSGTARPDRL